MGRPDNTDQLVELANSLIEQNVQLSCKLIALENIVAYTLARTFVGRDKAELEMADLTAEISGTAVAIADSVNPISQLGAADLSEISKSMERVIILAEKTLHQSLRRR
jgi:hypothetical protein